MPCKDATVSVPKKIRIRDRITGFFLLISIKYSIQKDKIKIKDKIKYYLVIPYVIDNILH